MIGCALPVGNMALSNPTIPFGDVVQRVASSIFNDLQQLLGLLHSIGPETRTLKLATFLADAKKKLYQLLIIKKWLASNNTTGYFKSLQQIDFIIQNTNLQFNMMQDNLFRLHGELYGKRVRSINVKLGYDVLSSGTYDMFPLSVLTCGQLPLPNDPVLHSEGTSHLTPDTSETKVRKDLEIYIRAKLLLHDPVPTTTSSAVVRDGVLFLKQTNLYEVAVTLQHLHPGAPWLVLGCRVLCTSHVSEFKNTASVRGYDVRACEEAVYTCLDELSGNDECWKTMMSLDTRLQSVPSASAVTPCDPADQNTNSVTAVIAEKKIVSPLTLSQINRICTHAAEGVLLRILYTQLQDLKRSKLWTGRIEVDFQDVGPVAFVALRFCKSSLTGQYRYELQVLSLHQPVQVGSGKSSESAFGAIPNSHINDGSHSEPIPSSSSSSAVRSATSNNISDTDTHESERSSHKTLLRARLLVLDDLGNLNLPNLNPATADTEGLVQLQIDRLLKEYQDRSATVTDIHRVRHSVLSSELNLDKYTVIEGVSSRCLLGDTLRLLARARIKVAAARVFMSPQWASWRQQGLELVMDLNTYSLTLRLSYAPATALVLHVDTRDGQWCYHEGHFAPFVSHHCVGLVDLFLTEANNILSDQLTSGTLVSEHVQAEVDRALALTHTAETSTKPFVYLRPSATVDAVLSSLLFIHTLSQSVTATGVTQPTLTRQQWTDLLKSAHGSKVTSGDINLCPAYVFQLESWNLPSSKSSQSDSTSLLDQYRSLLPKSVPYFDSKSMSSTAPLSKPQSNQMLSAAATSSSSVVLPQPSATTNLSTTESTAQPVELKPFLKRFLNLDGHDDNILMKKKVRKSTSVNPSGSTAGVSQRTLDANQNNMSSTGGSSVGGTINNSNNHSSSSDDKEWMQLSGSDASVLVLIHSSADFTTVSVHCVLVTYQRPQLNSSDQPAISTNIADSTQFTVLKTECLVNDIPSDEAAVALRSQLPLLVAAAVQWKNQIFAPARVDLSLLLSPSPTSAYVHVTHPGVCVVLRPSTVISTHNSSVCALDLVGFVDVDRGFTTANSTTTQSTTLVPASTEVLRYIETKKDCKQAFKISLNFTAPEYGTVLRDGVNLVSVSVTQSESRDGTQESVTHVVLQLLFQRYLASTELYSSNALLKIFGQSSFRRLCVLSVFLSLLESHSNIIAACSSLEMVQNTFGASSSDSNPSVVRMKLCHVNAQNIDQPVAVLALESLCPTCTDPRATEWNLHGFIQVTVNATTSVNPGITTSNNNSGSESIKLHFQDAGRHGFEDTVDATALVSEKMLNTLLQRLLTLHQLFFEHH